MKSPCYKCNKRHYKCHSNCLHYNNFKKEIEKKKQYLNKDINIISYECDKKRKYNKNKKVNLYDL